MSRRDYQECTCGHAMYVHDHPRATPEEKDKPREYGKCTWGGSVWLVGSTCYCQKFTPRPGKKAGKK